MLVGRLRSPLVGVAVGLFVLIGTAGIAGAAPPPTPPDEAYPPAAVVNLLDPFGCAPESITGNIGEVLPGSTVTLELLLGGTVISTATATAGSNGHAIYSIPVPPDRFGPVLVRATGVNTLNEPFTIHTSGTIVDCPEGPQLPATGNSGLGGWLRGGAALVLAGVAMVVVALRRRRHAIGGAG